MKDGGSPYSYDKAPLYDLMLVTEDVYICR